MDKKDAIKSPDKYLSPYHIIVWTCSWTLTVFAWLIDFQLIVAIYVMEVDATI